MAFQLLSARALVRCFPSRESRQLRLPASHSCFLFSHRRDDAVDSPSRKTPRPEEKAVGVEEARRLLRLVNVEAMKTRLECDRQECMSYGDLLRLCQSMGVASSHLDAEAFAKTLDDAGVVFIFRGKVYLHPQQVAKLVANAVPLSFTCEDHPCLLEWERMRREKDEIDKVAHKQVCIYLWQAWKYLVKNS